MYKQKRCHTCTQLHGHPLLSRNIFIAGCPLPFFLTNQYLTKLLVWVNTIYITHIIHNIILFTSQNKYKLYVCQTKQLSQTLIRGLTRWHHWWKRFKLQPVIIPIIQKNNTVNLGIIRLDVLSVGCNLVLLLLLWESQDVNTFIQTFNTFNQSNFIQI